VNARRLLVDRRELWVVLLGIVLGIATILYLGRNGWEGWRPHGGLARGDWFCEDLGPGAVRQPANTWSNLGFCLAALFLCSRIGREAVPRNRMTATRFYPAFYAALVAFLGVGSMCLHASWTHWGGFIDVVSMLVYAAFLVAYAGARQLRVGRGGFSLLYLVIAGTAVWLYAFYPAWEVRVFGSTWQIRVFAILLFLWLVGEVPILVRGRCDRRWLGAAGVCFFTAYAVWVPSHNGGWLCNPSSLLQGHAVWHLLCAGATLCIHAYYCSERESDSRGAP
jgi:Ceramidase